MFKNGSIPSFQYVCSGRDKFESHLRTRGIYDSCLSRYFLMNKQGADWTTVMTYIRLYQHLDFICNQGFEQIAQKSTWFCLQANLNTGCDQTCDNNWNNWNGNYATLCPTVQSYSSCKKTCWDQNCAGTSLGYYACEDVRIGFAQDCRGLRCYVN
uniref:Uncharacterized protein n=1 Tax=Acrobeloides nanus TaxID=290746 RepID=A0A914CEQ1_9BILA